MSHSMLRDRAPVTLACGHNLGIPRYVVPDNVHQHRGANKTTAASYRDLKSITPARPPQKLPRDTAPCLKFDPTSSSLARGI